MWRTLSVVAAMAIGSLGTAGCGGMTSCGMGGVGVTVRVTDAESGRPLSGVKVSGATFDRRDEPAVTGADGRASVTAMVGMGWYTALLYKEYHVYPSSGRLVLERPGYATTQATPSDERFVKAPRLLGIGGPPSFSRDVVMMPLHAARASTRASD